MVPDFTGYVTRYGVKCSDGRTIRQHAFRHNDGAQIPMVWQHMHNDPDNVLGHLVLRHKDDGVWAEGFFNTTPSGQQAKALVAHKDVRALSIYATQIVQKGMDVLHGNLKEGSLVLSGANPGAFIENVNIQHGDTITLSEDEVIIFSGEDIAHAGSTTIPQPAKITRPKGDMPMPGMRPTSDNPDPDGDGDNDLFDPEDGGLGPDASVQDVLDTLTPEQKNVVYALIGAAMQQSDLPADATNQQVFDSLNDVQKDVVHSLLQEALNHSSNTKGDPVSRNVFDPTDDDVKRPRATLTHSDIQGIFASAHKGGSLKGAVEEYALAHNIDDVSLLFPYDKAVTDSPEFISRRMEWVAGVLGSVHRTPFSRIRSWTADITLQEARAKGFVKASMKKEEFVRIARRITTPQTVYKKQKLDRDDILDITDFDVVQWLQTEMRIMLDEELARAVLIGDGRDVDDPDKISTSNVRPIYGDDELYVTQINVAKTAIDVALNGPDAIVDAVVNSMRFYRGSGNPVMYTTRIWMAKMLLTKDTLGRRLYPTVTELSAALGVNNVIPCEALEAQPDLIGIIVNLTDYTIGADKGGEVSMFDFFDIDYNQFKYLMETRVSGAMTKYRGALVVQQIESDTILGDPLVPTFDDATGIGTIPAFSGLHYTYVTVADDGTESAALTAGAQASIASGAYVTYRAVPDSGYQFATDAFDWTFRRD